MGQIAVGIRNVEDREEQEDEEDLSGELVVVSWTDLGVGGGGLSVCM